MNPLASELAVLEGVQPLRIVGRVAALRGMTVLVEAMAAPVGSLVRIGDGLAGEGLMGEVVGFDRDRAVVMSLGTGAGVRAGDPVELVETTPTAGSGPGLLGRVIDGLGRPLDGGEPPRDLRPRALAPTPIGALERRAIDRQLLTGVRAVDLMTPVGRGQRLGIFAGPGVGKSTLLGQIARGTDADASVIALIGERGREVGEFIEDSLGEEGLKRSVVVVATGDESPVMRLRAARRACAIAEGFRDDGLDVLLMMDSVTRFAHAQRQVGLSAGEPPATRGYTPSVFAELALLLERAGTTRDGGSITGLYTILVEGDDMTEPVADAARGILDGHLILSRKLAQAGRFPAIDVLDSVSRVADRIVSTEHRAARAQLVRIMAAFAEIEELVQIGAYASGTNHEADVAIELRERCEELLRHGSADRGVAFEDARRVLVELAHQSGELVARRRASAGGQR
ncbi:MAG: FliI/YscN family ATPase [Planctomycetota bacterium]